MSCSSYKNSQEKIYMQNLPKTRLIVFDWDGTLFDSTGVIAHSLQKACEALGMAAPTTQEAKHVIGLGFNEAIEQLVGPLNAEQSAAFMTAYRRNYFAGESLVTLYDGILELLKGLQGQGRLMAVATGKSRAGLNRVLLDGHLRPYFDATRTADETTSKPHPQMLLELLDELEVSPHQAVMVGDTTYDIDMANAAGMASIAVKYGAHDEKLLLASRPTVVVHDVNTLTKVLGVQKALL